MTKKQNKLERLALKGLFSIALFLEVTIHCKSYKLFSSSMSKKQNKLERLSLKGLSVLILEVRIHHQFSKLMFFVADKETE